MSRWYGHFGITAGENFVAGRHSRFLFTEHQ
jgi:hypothetical protein